MTLTGASTTTSVAAYVHKKTHRMDGTVIANNCELACVVDTLRLWYLSHLR
jgi:hypothetical protein